MRHPCNSYTVAVAAGFMQGAKMMHQVLMRYNYPRRRTGRSRGILKIGWRRRVNRFGAQVVVALLEFVGHDPRRALEVPNATAAGRGHVENLPRRQDETGVGVLSDRPQARHRAKKIPSL